MTLPRALYDGLLAQVYDDYTGADDRGDETLWTRLAAESGGLILELGCGTGRVLLPLLAAGHKIEGLDNSPDMLAICEARGREMALSPILTLADMAAFTIARQFGLIFCAAGSLTLLAEPGQMEAALRRSRGHLESGGVLALSMDAPSKPATGRVVARDIIRESDGSRLRCILDPLPDPNAEIARWRMTNEITPPSGPARRETAEIAFRRPHPEAFATMLRACGFGDVTLLDESGERPVGADDESYIAIAR